MLRGVFGQVTNVHMAKDLRDIFSFIRTLAPEAGRVYGSNDILRFRPAYEYLQTRESGNCLHCKSLVYRRSGDVRVLSLFDIVAARHKAPLFTFDNAVLDTMSSMSKKIDDFLGALFGNDSLKKEMEKSCRNLQDRLGIDTSLIANPLFHRCPACLYAWPLHLEIKQRIQFAGRYSPGSPGAYNPFLGGAFNLIPLTPNFLAGLILLDDPAENGQIGLHVFDYKRFQLGHRAPGLLPGALKKIRMADAAGSLADLATYVADASDDFFRNQVHQLQARLAAFNQERIRGRTSPEEQSIEFNRICADILLLIEEMERYKNM